jgi:D-alanyl-D-alanine carboxypeptidase
MGRAPSVLRATRRLLAAALVLSLCLAACGPAQPAPAPSQTPTGTPTRSVPLTPTLAPTFTDVATAIAPVASTATQTATATPVASLTAPVASLTAPAQAWASGALADIDTAAQQAVTHIPLAGLTLAVRYGARPVYTQGYGRADLAAKVPAQANTPFEIASLTKQFTAAAIMQLAAQGRLGLDDHASQYFPDLPAVAGGITLRQLLNHTSGLPNNDYIYVLLGQPQVYAPADVVTAYFQGLKALDFEPGSQWEYSNMGYFLLGDILEQVSGQTYADYLQQHLFGPAGLTATTYCPTPPPGLPQGYQFADSQFQPVGSDNLSLYAGAGGLCSTAADLIRWQQALTGGRIIRASDYQAMITPATLPNGKLLTYGFGLKVGDYGGQTAVYHQGQVPGFSSVLVYYPDADITVALLTNTAVPIVLLDTLAGQIRTLITAEP